MRKNGFTLIELLAVIVIITIIALIATPLILNVIDKAKKGAFKDSVYGIMKAAEYASVDYRLTPGSSGDVTFTFDNGDISSVVPLEFNGKAMKKGILVVSADGKVQLALTDGEYCATKDFDDVDVSVSSISNEDECQIEIPMLMIAPGYGFPFLNGPLSNNEVKSLSFATTNEVPSGVVGSWDVSADQNGVVMAWYVESDTPGLYDVTIGGKGKVYANPNSSYLFAYLRYIEEIDFTNFDASLAQNMSYMFHDTMDEMDILDLSYLNTSNATNMEGMFGSFRGSGLNLSNFDTSNVTDMTGMFSRDHYLEELDLSHFDTSSVTNMSGMFYATWDLENLNVSNFNTSNVTDMSQMFFGARSIVNLDLSSFDTSSVVDMNNMFYYMDSLEVLDFRNATFDSVSNYSGMFTMVKDNMTIYTKDSMTKLWLDARLSDVGKTGDVVIP